MQSGARCISESRHGMAIELNLVVIYTADLQLACDFYRCLGLVFVSERHGTGPEHYAATLGQVVFELYPRKPETPSTQLRLGFRVPAVESVVQQLQDRGVRIISAPKESPWGLRAVVADLDGNSVELVQSAG